VLRCDVAVNDLDREMQVLVHAEGGCFAAFVGRFPLVMGAAIHGFGTDFLARSYFIACAENVASHPVFENCAYAGLGCLDRRESP
jgi:hypothetical protein